MAEIETIFGAPGCGKTTKLMEILDTELKRTTPDKIAFVSFTRKGAYEGRDRAIKKFNLKEDDFPYFRTLHSIAFKELGLSRYDMIGKKDYKHFSEAMGMNFTGYYTEEFYNNDDIYLFLCFLKRNNIEAYWKYEKTHPYLDINKLDNVIMNYERYKKEYNIFDFTNILENAVYKKIRIETEVVIIDEAQDLTTLQWMLVSTFFHNCKRAYIAGDDDQAIYEWNGSDLNVFLNIKSKRTVLNQSYRLRKNILNFSKTITSRIQHRVEKIFKPIDEGGNILWLNELNELSNLNEDETYYFLTRNNWFLCIYRNYLRSKGYVYYDKEKLSIDYHVVDAINIFEKARKSNQEEIIKLINKIKIYVGENYDLGKPWFMNFKLPIEETEYYRKIIQYKRDIKNIKITISTIHGVKGGEADNVIMLMDFTKACLESFTKNMDAELRCLYVAFTRAKKSLTLIHSYTKNGYDQHLDL